MIMSQDELFLKHFPKSGNRFWDKKCVKIKSLSADMIKSKTANALQKLNTELMKSKW